MLFNKNKKIRVFISILIGVLGLISLTIIVPVEFSVVSLDSIKKENFIIIQFDYYLKSWLLVGDETGLYEPGKTKDWPVIIEEGDDPLNILSGDLYLTTGLYYIIYGTVKKEEYSNSTYAYTIKSSGWDILGDVKRLKNSCRPYFSKKYLTIYDYKWFDRLLEPLGLYSDHPDY